jgi:hypothetical protein
MSTESGVGFTRVRDLLAVALVSVLAGFLLVRLSYGQLPTLPRLAGLPPAVLGIGEALVGLGVRSRLRNRDRSPLPSLTAARVVMTAKASSLAGAAFAGLWIGVLLYTAPLADQIVAAGKDTTSGVFGLAGAVVMIAGALWLEHCCRTPPEPRRTDELR